MGFLDQLFGGNAQQGAKGSGGMSPMTLALLALLAYRTYQGKGRLADMLGRGQPQPGGPSAPDAPARQSQGEGGGLGSVLSEILRGGQRGPMSGNPAAPAGGGLGDLLRGGLGGLLGGAAAGGLLNGGLQDLMRRFQQSGQGDAAHSWIGAGANREVTPDELERAIGRDTLEELSTQTGAPYEQVLSELSESLPQTVDRLTPEGRMPTEEEAARWV